MTRKEILDIKDLVSDPVRMERMRNRLSWSENEAMKGFSRLTRYETSGTLAEMVCHTADLSDLRKEWKASFEAMQLNWIQDISESYKQKQEALNRSCLSAIRVLRRKGKIKGRLTPGKVQRVGITIGVFHQTEPAQQYVVKRTPEGKYVKFFKNLKAYEAGTII